MLLLHIPKDSKLADSVVFDVYISNKKPELPASEMGYVVKLLDVENSKRIIGEKDLAI